MPQTGRFNLGLELPVRWEHAAGRAGPPARQRLGERAVLRVAANLEGRLVLDVLGSAELVADGRVRAANLELRMDFTAADGSTSLASQASRAVHELRGGGQLARAGSSDSAG